MEQFKVCEKETKTKTYSKEGLARETKIHEQINEIKEDVEYYIDANQEPDFMDAYDETMDIFESLDLGDLPTDEDAAAAAAANTDEKKKKKKKGDDDDDDEKDDKKKKKRQAG
ncbi:hypothetical protein JL721_10847 [Aureococcus anophagefferens]|nr:hypothetical protein JL721_10847 [Aureococcus anophagefferens]